MGDTANFAEYIATERQRLNFEREAILSQKRELDAKLTELDKEAKAIDAYEAAKSGTTAARSNSTRRARKGSRREEIAQLVREAGAISRGELIQRLGVKGDKSGEMSVSNALTALTKTGQLARDGRQYVYQAAA